MVASIAPEPVSTGLGELTDYRSRTLLGDSRAAQRQFVVISSASNDEQPVEDGPSAPPPTPSAAPGSTFEAAVLAGQLTRRPNWKKENVLRFGNARLPAQGALALRDRRV
ncbi:MAG: hypothetical protein QM702_10850 [Rubrivivax sp.]